MCRCEQGQQARCKFSLSQRQQQLELRVVQARGAATGRLAACAAACLAWAQLLSLMPLESHRALPRPCSM